MDQKCIRSTRKQFARMLPQYPEALHPVGRKIVKNLAILGSDRVDDNDKSNARNALASNYARFEKIKNAVLPKDGI